MLKLLAAFALCVSFPAFAAYDITATMPPTTGTPTGCELVLDGVPTGGVRACGTPVAYPSLIATEGTYEFRYRLRKSDGTNTALSPARTVTLTLDVIDPAEPPGVTVTCADAAGSPVACPPYLSIIVTP